MAILVQGYAGLSVPEVSRKHDISSALYYQRVCNYSRSCQSSEAHS